MRRTTRPPCTLFSRNSTVDTSTVNTVQGNLFAKLVIWASKSWHKELGARGLGAAPPSMVDGGWRGIMAANSRCCFLLALLLFLVSLGFLHGVASLVGPKDASLFGR